jgi:hypothetical protein
MLVRLPAGIISPFYTVHCTAEKRKALDGQLLDGCFGLNAEIASFTYRQYITLQTCVVCDKPAPKITCVCVSGTGHRHSLEQQNPSRAVQYSSLSLSLSLSLTPTYTLTHPQSLYSSYPSKLSVSQACIVRNLYSSLQW